MGLSASAPAASASSRSPSVSAPLYLALGDSLATGYQPGDLVPGTVSGPPGLAGAPFGGFAGGYANDLASARGLSLVDLGCPGETTVSFDTTASSLCGPAYQAYFHAASQEAAALAFLARYPNQVALVTIDLGADNLLGCASLSGVNLPCVASGVRQLQAQLPAELTVLRGALKRYDPHARLVAMNYYDPFLAAELAGRYSLAVESLGIVTGINEELSTIYGSAHIPVADVAGAFRTYQVLPFVPLAGTWAPYDVGVVCNYTYMCGSSPDVHPNDTGYSAIAGAFTRVLPH